MPGKKNSNNKSYTAHAEWLERKKKNRPKQAWDGKTKTWNKV